MFPIQFVVTPLVAGFVGYITNKIAIKMLFRLKRAYYIFGCRLWFTPGLIPKERVRIASSIGTTISENLMNGEVLSKTLLSDEMIEKVEYAVESFINDLRCNNLTLRQFLSSHISSDDLAHLETSAVADLTSLIGDKLANSGLGDKIAHVAVEHAISKMSSGLTGVFGIDKLVRLLQGPAEDMLRKNIDEMLRDNALQMAGSIIDNGFNELMDTSVRVLLDGKESQLETMKKGVARLYRITIEQQLPHILKALDLPKVIENRINDMDIDEVERLILEIMDKELKAIEWFGALLGVLIGLFNLLFIQ